MIDMRKYNALGRLIEVYRDGLTAQYLYRPDGLRHRKTVRPKYGVPQTTWHYWDDQNILAESTVNGIKATYVRGSMLIAQQLGSQTWLYRHNARGDVVQRICEDGNAAPKYVYDAFGIQHTNDATDPNPFRYCGEYYDTERAEVYLRARTYDPRTGRFTQADPLKTGATAKAYDTNVNTLTKEQGQTASAQSSLYAYCDNNPILRRDASGNAWETMFDVASLCVSIADYVQEPTLLNAAMLVWDVAAVVAPGVPGSYVADGIKAASKATKEIVQATTKEIAQTAVKEVAQEVAEKIVPTGLETVGNIAGQVMIKEAMSGKNMIETGRAVYKAADATSSLKDAQYVSGAYEILFASGKNYVGKGHFNRMLISAKDHMVDYADEVVSMVWRPAISAKDAFIDEYLMQMARGVTHGKISDVTYNVIWSPGKKYWGALH